MKHAVMASSMPALRTCVLISAGEANENRCILTEEYGLPERLAASWSSVYGLTACIVLAHIFRTEDPYLQVLMLTRKPDFWVAMKSIGCVCEWGIDQERFYAELLRLEAQNSRELPASYPLG